MGVTLCAAAAGSVLVINVVLTLVAYTKYGLSGGLVTFQDGSCQRTKELSLWLHLAINVLSTLLLGASNYCMQCLVSPTREEVESAHSEHVWLDIGVPSVRNLTRISRRRVMLWAVLAISGVPLHLLYNSTIFSTLASQEYAVFAASPDLIDNPAHNWSTTLQSPGEQVPNYTLQNFRNASSWERLENDACIKAYSQTFVSGHGDLPTISSDINASMLIQNVAYAYPETFNMYIPQDDWIFHAYPQLDDYDTNYILQRAAKWVVSDDRSDLYTVQYCLSEHVEERCRVQFSIVIMSISMLCNLVKSLCMLLTLRLQYFQPLVTPGDAMESFLRRADPTTKGMCLARIACFSQYEWEKAPMKWKALQNRWFLSASGLRWLTCNIL